MPAKKKVVKSEKEKIKTAKKPSVKDVVKKIEKEKEIIAGEGKAAEKKAAAPVAGRYIYAVGRRKSAVARVRVYEKGTGNFQINGKEMAAHFPIFQLSEMVLAPLKLTGQLKNHDFSVLVKGGGKHGQAEAVRHGLTRALVKWNADFKPTLKKAGFLTRDPRVKERKKFGLKKARRAPQWAKR